MDKKEKKEFARKIKREEFVREVQQMPISKKDLRDLFNYLDRYEAVACDHSLRQTIEFLEKRGLDPRVIVPWLHQYGGFCDCEVLFNVEGKWGEFVEE